MWRAVKKTCFKTVYSGLAAILLAGCSYSVTSEDLHSRGFHPVDIQTNSFLLRSQQHYPLIPKLPLIIYIEGDGRAWRSISTPSSDPTPVDAVALKLALQDPRPNITYLARPCQYLVSQPLCRDNKWWTGDRFSEPVITAMDQAIDKIKASPAQPIELIGFSGGAAIAVDIAARRADVISLQTIAGNLDPALLNSLHNVTPMPASVDPMQFATRLRTLPQIHYTGSEDDVVTDVIAKSFSAAAGQSPCVQLKNIENMDHSSVWAEKWPQLLQIKPKCL